MGQQDGILVVPILLAIRVLGSRRGWWSLIIIAKPLRASNHLISPCARSKKVVHLVAPGGSAGIFVGRFLDLLCMWRARKCPTDLSEFL